MTNPGFRPPEAAPGGMRGTQRMFDPSEAAHDRTRRRWMIVGLVGIALLELGQVAWIGVRGWEWLVVVFLVVAGAPLGMAVKVFELRFKLAHAERTELLRGLPRRRQLTWLLYGLVVTAAVVLHARLSPWALLGAWVQDFYTYYHDRPERMRHLYAVTRTLDELRQFPLPWAWAVPALLAGLL